MYSDQYLTSLPEGFNVRPHIPAEEYNGANNKLIPTLLGEVNYDSWKYSYVGSRDADTPLTYKVIRLVITNPSKQHQESKRVNKQEWEALTIKRTEKPNNQFSPSYANEKHRKALETEEAKLPKPTTPKMALKIPHKYHINIDSGVSPESLAWGRGKPSYKSPCFGQTCISCIPDIARLLWFNKYSFAYYSALLFKRVA